MRTKEELIQRIVDYNVDSIEVDIDELECLINNWEEYQKALRARYELILDELKEDEEEEHEEREHDSQDKFGVL